MDIKYRQGLRKWIVEVWSDDVNEHFTGDFNEPYPEEVYIDINNWCKDVLGYHARTGYHIFELKNQKHLNWFLIRWQA